MRTMTYLVRFVRQGQREMLEDDVSVRSVRKTTPLVLIWIKFYFIFLMNSKLYLKILYKRCLMEVARICGVVNVRVRVLPSKRVTNRLSVLDMAMVGSGVWIWILKIKEKKERKGLYPLERWNRPVLYGPG